MTTRQGAAADVWAKPGVRAWAGLLQVHATLVPLLDRELQSEAGLSLAWYDVLLELNSASDRRLSMSDLANVVVLSRTRVSRLVDELERAGLVQRFAHPTDRRSTYAGITALGRRRLRAAAPVYLRGIAEHFARHLTRPEMDAIVAGLSRVQAAAASGS